MYLTAAQVCELLNISSNTLFGLTRSRAKVSGRSIPHCKFGKELRFNRDSVLTWAKSLEQ